MLSDTHIDPSHPVPPTRALTVRFEYSANAPWILTSIGASGSGSETQVSHQGPVCFPPACMRRDRLDGKRGAERRQIGGEKRGTFKVRRGEQSPGF
eukprot:3837218-Rhodomonas_salina.1